ncbi:MAG: hypothetical protein LBC20_17305 [Planctomycetaceae bacterium]|jgi:hypothetical protein|nr:hypothetical protein [Planctomycetaceae bacterium]
METKIGIVACTRGFSIDYGYAADGCEKQTAFEFGRVLDDQIPSIAVHKRTDNTFSVSIGCIPTKQHDSSGTRNIRIYLTFNGLTEEKSRDILLFYLEKYNENGHATEWAEVTEPFLQAFHWNQKSTDQNEQKSTGHNEQKLTKQNEREWDVDFQIIRNIIANIPHIECSDKRLSDRWEQNNNSINRHKLFDLLQTHTFSLSSGFKIVVTGPAPSQDSYEQLRKEVDRYLWISGRNEELKDTESEKISKDNDNKKKENHLILIILLILGIILVTLGIL